MSNVSQIYGTLRDSQPYIILNSTETEVSGNLTVLQNLDVCGNITFNNTDLSSALSNLVSGGQDASFTNVNITSDLNAHKIIGTNYYLGSKPMITGSQQATFRDLELKNWDSYYPNYNKETLIANGNTGDLSMNGTLNVSTINHANGVNIEGVTIQNNNVTISGDLTLNNTDISGKLSQIDASLVVLASGGGGGTTIQTNNGFVANYSGNTAGGSSVALLTTTGLTNQGDEAVAIGAHAGANSQDRGCIAIGTACGRYNQGFGAVSVGWDSGNTGQGDYSVALGNTAGKTNLGTNSIAIGRNASNSNTNGFENYIVLNGTGSALDPQKSNAFFVKPIQNETNSNKLLYNSTTGEITYQADSGGGDVVIHGTSLKSNLTGNGANTSRSISLGINAGYTGQGVGTIAIGEEAGKESQGLHGIAIGSYCARKNQNSYAIAVGHGCGEKNQKQQGVALGWFAGWESQGTNSIAIGNFTGYNTQGDNAIALGTDAGRTQPGNNSIVIGQKASFTNTNNYNNYIVLNAQTDTELNPENSNAFFVKPIRDATNSNKLLYNSSTGEITYQADSGGGGGGGTTIQTNNGFVSNYSGNTAGSSSVALLTNTGLSNQGNKAVAIGLEAGQISQGGSCVHIGDNAGYNSPSIGSIAIGRYAAHGYQGEYAIAIGLQAGQHNQGNNSVAIGNNAGYYLTANSIAIGHKASYSNNSNTNYIVLNAQTDTELNPNQSNAFFVKPIRDATNSNKLLYNSTTGEITYQPESQNATTGVIYIMIDQASFPLGSYIARAAFGSANWSNNIETTTINLNHVFSATASNPYIIYTQPAGTINHKIEPWYGTSIYIEKLSGTSAKEFYYYELDNGSGNYSTTATQMLGDSNNNVVLRHNSGSWFNGFATNGTFSFNTNGIYKIEIKIFLTRFL